MPSAEYRPRFSLSSARRCPPRPVRRSRHRRPTRTRRRRRSGSGQTDETDAHIRETFGLTISPGRGDRPGPRRALSREEQVGLVVLLDQFPRNIYRPRRGLRLRRQGARRSPRPGRTRPRALLSSSSRPSSSCPSSTARRSPTRTTRVWLFAGMAVARAGGGRRSGARNSRLRHQAPRHHPEVRPLPPPQRDARPRVDAGGAGVPQGRAGLLDFLERDERQLRRPFGLRLAPGPGASQRPASPARRRPGRYRSPRSGDLAASRSRMSSMSLLAWPKCTCELAHAVVETRRRRPSGA